MNNDTIITLETGKEYILLDNVIVEGKKYFMAVEYKKEDNSTTNEYKFFEEINNNGDIYIQEVVDEKMLQILLAHFISNYGDMLEEDIEFGEIK